MYATFPIIANGNVITYDEDVSNLECTGSDGIMRLRASSIIWRSSCQDMVTHLSHLG
jgi:hypothetical protein